jgi:anti-sigma factor ChrR (cupin superfamily)
MKTTSNIQEQHNEVWLSLPWYVNGTLESAENDLVAVHLRTCLVCRRELKRLQLLATVVRESELLQPVPEHSFEKLMQRIANDSRAARRGIQFTSVMRKVIDWIFPARQRLSWAQALVWALPVLLGVLFFFQLPDNNDAAVYHTLSDETEPGPYAEGHLRLVIDRSVTVEVLHELLQNCRVEIVGGLSAAGTYTLRTQTGQPSDSALKCLREIHYVQLAEPARLMYAH